MATKLPAKKTNLDIHAECEVAASILAECFAFFAKRLAAENQLEMPNQDKIDALEKQLSELYDAKLELDIDRPEIIYKALHIWAPLLRKSDQ